MKENVDTHIKSMTDRLFKETTLESPSMDFTAHVMSQVDVIAESDVTIYKPLISKRVWIVIIMAIIGLFSYVIFGNTAESEFLNSLDLTVVSDTKLANILSGFSFSKTILYAAAMFALMFAIQVTMLKGYFDRRLSI